MGEEVKISHKELLTFSNLTNLEWEFAELRVEGAEEEDFATTSTEYKPLKDLLTPEVFARRDAEGDIERYTYMDVRDINNVTRDEKDTGLAKMREKAGIAMEFLELEDDEGDFLQEWEVIYGADKYEIMKDYLDARNEVIRELAEIILDESDFNSPADYQEFLNSDSFPYQERDYYENLRESEDLMNRRKTQIKFVLELVNLGFGVHSQMKSSGAETVSGKIKDFIKKEAGKELFNKALGDKANEKSHRLAFFLTIIANPYSILENIDDIGSLANADIFDTIPKGVVEGATAEYEEGLEPDEDEVETLNRIINALEQEGIDELIFVEELDMYDKARYSEDEDGIIVLIY